LPIRSQENRKQGDIYMCREEYIYFRGRGITQGEQAIKEGVTMLRYCTICNNTFGCIMNDREKLECLTCTYFKNCFIRQLKTPPKKDMAEGVCGLCLLELQVSKEQWYSSTM
jgi:hypothetical protein